MSWSTACAEFDPHGQGDWKDPRENTSGGPSSSFATTGAESTTSNSAAGDDATLTWTLSATDTLSETSASTGDSWTSTASPTLQLGELCTHDEMCLSLHCVGQTSEGGQRCGECSADNECASGTCRYLPQGGATCALATSGESCRRDRDCRQGLVCDDSTAPGMCQPCRDDAQCPDHHYCARHVLGERMERSCQVEHAATLGDQCITPAQGSTERCCENQLCAAVPAPNGANSIFVCSECTGDSDCTGGKLCEVTGNVDPNFSWPMLTCVMPPSAG